MKVESRPSTLSKTILEIADDLRAGRTTSRALTEEAFHRIDDPAGEGARTFTELFRERALTEADEIWAIWLRASKRSLTLEQCIATSEPAYIARHAFQLAQEFNNFYHRHHILTEEDPTRKTLLLATAAIALRELVTVLSWLGIESPEAM